MSGSSFVLKPLKTLKTAWLLTSRGLLSHTRQLLVSFFNVKIFSLWKTSHSKVERVVSHSYHPVPKKWRGWFWVLAGLVEFCGAGWASSGPYILNGRAGSV